jgi:hypothetical protein
MHAAPHCTAVTAAAAAARFTLVPYAVTTNFQRWAGALAELGVSVFGESLDWIQNFGHKVGEGRGAEGDMMRAWARGRRAFIRV